MGDRILNRFAQGPITLFRHSDVVSCRQGTKKALQLI